MFVLLLYRYILGYVKFCGSDGFSERFINLCAVMGIPLWKTSCKDKKLYGYVLAKDYKKLRPCVRKSGVKLKILKRYGLSFIIHRYRKRTGIFVGFIFFIGIIYFLSLFIWNVDVTGNSKVDRDKILQVLAKQGVCEGSMRSRIDAEETRQNLLIKMPELSWAAINIKGTFATVDVRETVNPPQSTKSEIPCNIKAKIDGRILEIKVLAGTPMFKVGEAVVKGDLLVSGAVEHKNGVTILKHASAQVLAETHRTITVFIPYQQLEERKTGSVVTRRVVTVFGVKAPLFLGSIKGVTQREQKKWRLSVLGVNLPISVTTAKFYKIDTFKYTLDESGAKVKAEKELKKQQELQLPQVKIISSHKSFVKNNKGITLTVNYLCNENINIEENILINK